MNNYSILLVDDEENIRKTISVDLSENGYDDTLDGSGEEAIKKLGESNYDMVITALKMKGLSGIQVLEKTKKMNSETVVMIFSSDGDLLPAIEALRLGVDDYMLKSAITEELHFRVKHCLKKLELRRLVEKELVENRKKLIEKNEELKKISIRDGLTEIYNRRYFHQYFEREWKRAIRDKKLISLIMIDIDFFKLFNDTYGHLAGDNCLIQVANTLNDLVNRPADLFARYGGEEFVAILPGTEKDGTLLLAEEMRKAVEALKIEHTSSTISEYVTISLGVGTIFPDNKSSSNALIKLADKILYKVKQSGRNMVKSNDN
jgi:two-component system chemotaxis family response regulator WspR